MQYTTTIFLLFMTVLSNILDPSDTVTVNKQFQVNIANAWTAKTVYQPSSGYVLDYVYNIYG